MESRFNVDVLPVGRYAKDSEVDTAVSFCHMTHSFTKWANCPDIFILKMGTVVFSETLITPYETKWCHSPERRQSQLRHEFTFEARSWHIRFSDTSSNSGTAVLLLSNGSAKYTGIQSRGSMFCSFSIHWNILMLLSIDGTGPIVFPIETVWFVPLNILNFLPSFCASSLLFR